MDVIIDTSSQSLNIQIDLENLKRNNHVSVNVMKFCSWKVQSYDATWKTLLYLLRAFKHTHLCIFKVSVDSSWTALGCILLDSF